MIRVLFALLLMVSFSVQAADINLSWEAPTTRENGDSLPLSDIESYKLTVTYPDGSIGDINVEPTETSYTIPIINGPGDYTFTILAVDTDGMESKPSESISTSILERHAPSAIPTINLTVNCRKGSVCNFYEVSR